MEPVVLRFPGAGKPLQDELGDLTGFRIVQCWGTTTGPVRQHSDFEAGKPVDGILNHNGEWWAICRDDRGRLLILSDPFSLQPLYYAAVWTPQGPDLLVGSKVDATAQAMHGLGAKVETEWAGVLPSLFASHGLYDTMHDVLTPVARLLVSLPDQAILVDGAGYKMIARPCVRKLQTSYQDLLRAGVERATSEISTTLRDAGAESAVLNLSGGKDSRLVLAMIMAGGVTDRLTIHAVDPKPGAPGLRQRILTEDLAISSRLVARYGLSWASATRDREIWPDTLDGQLFRFQHHRGGRSYQFVPNPLSYRLIEPEVRFTGAGAGALRSPWATAWKEKGIWASLEGTQESFNRDAMKVFRKTAGAMRAPAAVDGRAMNRFVATLRGISDGTIDSAIAAHYRSFRNRGHVGGQAWGRSMGVINANPLLQPEFAAASRLLAPADRDDGRMTFDLLELLDPSLNDLEFQSGPWPWAEGRPARLDWSRYPENAASFFEAKKQAAVSNPRPTFAGRTRPDMQPMIRRGLNQLNAAAHEAKLPGENILHSLQQDLPSELPGQGRLLTKLATWAHCMADPGVFSLSANPLRPQVVTISSDKDASWFP